jgi:acyl-CoA synthetase (AMP-forming)/AMP-acid ligase II
MSADRTWSQLVIARRFSEDTAVAGERPVSYAELIGLADAAAEWLDQAGVPAGTAVPALLTTSPLALALVVAGSCTQRPVAPLGPRLTPRELAGCIDGLDAPLLVAEPEFAEQARAAAQRAGRRLLILPPLDPGGRRLLPEARPDAIAAILHTSGTTGAPKQVPITQDRLAARVGVSSRLMGVGPASVYASGSPFYHIAGLGNLAVMIAVGAAVLPFPRFSVESWTGLGKHGVTHAFLVPTMIERLLDADALTLPGLRLLQYGSAPIRPATLSRAISALPGVSFINMFGQTEGSPIACLVHADHDRALAGRPDLLASVGRAAPGIELRLAGTGAEEVGEILARGAHLFRAAEDGWLHTGDLARMDDDGYVYLIGRLGDRIKRGGENVHPVEVEGVLCEHPAVLEVAVVGIPDEEFGQLVRAYLVLDPGVPAPSHEELRAFARAELAGFKVPTSWVFVPDLPRNASGKVLRRVLAGAIDHQPDLRGSQRCGRKRPKTRYGRSSAPPWPACGWPRTRGWGPEAMTSRGRGSTCGRSLPAGGSSRPGRSSSAAAGPAPQQRPG